MRRFDSAPRLQHLPGILLALALDREQLDFKNERGVRRDVGSVTGRAVGEIRWDEKLPLRSDRHQLKGLRPPLDHSIYGECDRLAALVGAVKFRVVEESAFIV